LCQPRRQHRTNPACKVGVPKVRVAQSKLNRLRLLLPPDHHPCRHRNSNSSNSNSNSNSNRNRSSRQ
jgi:hypothetical protein